MTKHSTNNSGFFCNKECEYFPCHETNDPDNFNCMFCYCPLYMLGDQCGGDFVYIDASSYSEDSEYNDKACTGKTPDHIEPKKIKDCSGCLKAHDPDFQDTVAAMWDLIKARAK